MVLPTSIKTIGWGFNCDENTLIYYSGTAEEWEEVENNTNISPMFPLSIDHSYTVSTNDGTRVYYFIPDRNMTLTVTCDVDPWNVYLYVNGESIEHTDYITDAYGNTHVIYRIELLESESYCFEFRTTWYEHITVTIEKD